MLVLNLLGTPEIKLNETAVSLTTAKARALLFYLAVTGQPHSREKLLDLLWSEMPSAKARRNLTATLTSLRKQLADYVLVDGDTISFNHSAAHWLDIVELSCCLDDDDPKQLQAGVSLYRGEFLAGFAVKNAFVFEEWVLATSGRIREQVVLALTRLVETAVIHNSYTDGLACASRLLEIEPWLENGHRQLMILYARNGRVDAALAQYEKCCQILAEELGVTPSAATQALHERLQLARERQTSSLPDDGTQFIGRQHELAFVLEQVRRPECRLLTIVGLGGMGKTRLALAAAQAVAEDDAVLFLNGVTFVPLVGMTNRDSMFAAILAALAVTPRRGPLPEQVMSSLRRRELLLILDNFENLLNEVSAIQRIVSECPDVTLLITSREALGISVEHRLDLNGLAAPPESPDFQDAAHVESVALFLAVARQSQPKFILDETSVPHVLEICRMVDGMPLAIKLAASWLRALPITEIVTQLQSGIDILTTRMRDIPIRQRTVRAIFDQTVALLTADEAAVLVRLSAFRDGFTVVSAREVAQATPLVLGELVDRGLVQLDETGRYHIHELLRQYAAEQRNNAANIAYVEYMAAWIVARIPELYDSRQGNALRQIEIEFSNIADAWQMALAEDRFDLLAQFVEPLSRFVRLRGRLPEGINLLESAIDRAAATGAAQTEARLRNWLGTLYFFSGEHETAMQLYQDALGLAELVNDKHILGNASFHVAQVLHFQGKTAEAIPPAERAHQYFSQEDYAHGLIGTMNLLGQLFRRRGQVDEARHWFLPAVELGRKSQDSYTLLVPLNNLGLLLHECGDFAGSLALYEESETLLQQLGETQDGLVMLNFGRNFEALGEIDRAAAMYEGAIPVFEKQHTQHYVWVAKSWASRAARLLGNLVQARQWVNEALHGFRQANTRYSIADAMANLGDIELAQADLDAAKQVFQESLALMRQLGRPDGELRAVAALARVALARSNLDAAQEWLETGIRLAAQTHQVMLHHWLLAVLADYLAAIGKRPYALALFNWIHQQPTAAWETRQYVWEKTAVWQEEDFDVTVIPPNKPVLELLILDPTIRHISQKNA